MNVLITGGLGFIGHWLIQEKPRHSGLNLIAMGTKPYQENPWDSIGYDYIIHLAPVPIDRVLECAKRCGATILLASSGGVYDRDPSPYFEMKIEDERKLMATDLDYKIARIFTTCGAHMKWSRYAIGNFIMQAEKGGPIEVQSHGLVVRSYMYGSDLAEWLWAMLLHGEPGGIYNVGSDVPHSTAELAWEIAGNYDSDAQPDVLIIPKMQYEPRPFYVPDISRARDELGLTIKVPFEEAVARTIKDYRNER